MSEDIRAAEMRGAQWYRDRVYGSPKRVHEVTAEAAVSWGRERDDYQDEMDAPELAALQGYVVLQVVDAIRHGNPASAPAQEA